MDLVVDPKIEKEQEFEAILRAHDIYPTRQRISIASILFSRNQHVTSDQLHDALREKRLLVSKATVYNTLGLFVEKGLLREIVLDGGSTFYDSNNSHHYHFYNVDTGELFDIPENLPFRIDGIELPVGTVVEDIDIVVKIRNNA